jgi:hypothetical protein
MSQSLKAIDKPLGYVQALDWRQTEHPQNEGVILAFPERGRQLGSQGSGSR